LVQNAIHPDNVYSNRLASNQLRLSSSSMSGMMNAGSMGNEGITGDRNARTPVGAFSRQFDHIAEQYQTVQATHFGMQPHTNLIDNRNMTGVSNFLPGNITTNKHELIQRNVDTANGIGTIAEFSMPQQLNLPHHCEGKLMPFNARPRFPLGIDEDENWLSEFHCFVRMELVEVYRAGDDECKARYNSITQHQVGIRCRYCAHSEPSARAGRSSAFPSSLRQIYQSFTMMLRDHFPKCDHMTPEIRQRFTSLKDKPSQGATDSKRYWIYSAMKVGIADSANGMMITPTTLAAANELPPFGTSPEQRWVDEGLRDVAVVVPSDQGITKQFYYFLLQQTKVVKLTEAERIGNRRSLVVGLPGLGCRFCAEKNRLGLCRVFPARRRTLPSKISDLHDHLRRCPLCPFEIKQRLEQLRKEENNGILLDGTDDKDFFDSLWTRLGHGTVHAANWSGNATPTSSRVGNLPTLGYTL
jgi:hypothetical protein